MPYLLRRRLVCFYCGHKSSQYRIPDLRQWHCAQCDAINHLDEHGEITDPPIAESPQPGQNYKYATEAAKSISPDLSAPINTIFCLECQKNQHIFVETLATYLPDPSDPRYAEYERNLPAYRRQLEERYPQVCAKCVHLVNNRIESMTYLARTENLKLSLAKTRKGLMPLQSGWRVKDIVIRLGAFMWWFAVLGQFIWHLFGLTVSTSDALPTSLSQCLLRVAYTFAIDLACYRSLTRMVPAFLVAGWLSIWWNPQLHKTATGYGRLKNLNDYYFSQFIFLSLRSAAFWVITSQQHFLEIPYERIHGAFVIFMAIFAIASSNIVQIRRLPALADYKLEKVQAPEGNALTLDAPLADAHLQQSPTHNTFPLSAMAPSVAGTASVLGSASRRKISDSTDMSTLPDREWLQERMDEESSEMDWTPTQPSFTPREPVQHKVKEQSYTPQPSPFKHKLPPAPEHPLHKARKPPTQPTFHRASEEKRSELRENFGKPSVFDNWGLPAMSHRSHEMSMGAPKLKLSQQETGLENLFNSVFSLQDEPRTAQTSAASGVIDGTKVPSPWPRTAIGILLVTMPISIAAAWLLTRRGSGVSWDTKYSPPND